MPTRIIMMMQRRHVAGCAARTIVYLILIHVSVLIPHWKVLLLKVILLGACLNDCWKLMLILAVKSRLPCPIHVPWSVPDIFRGL